MILCQSIVVSPEESDGLSWDCLRLTTDPIETPHRTRLCTGLDKFEWFQQHLFYHLICSSVFWVSFRS
jgi:hypothetical protein